MTVPKLKLLVCDAKVNPTVNEMERHQHFQQPELFNFCIENGVAPIDFCPIGSPMCPALDKTPGDTVVIEDPVVLKITGSLGVHPAVVYIKWAMQRGQTSIPFSI